MLRFTRLGITESRGCLEDIQELNLKCKGNIKNNLYYRMSTGIIRKTGVDLTGLLCYPVSCTYRDLELN
jgi:hypothetical protein